MPSASASITMSMSRVWRGSPWNELASDPTTMWTMPAPSSSRLMRASSAPCSVIAYRIGSRSPLRPGRVRASREEARGGPVSRTNLDGDDGCPPGSRHAPRRPCAAPWRGAPGRRSLEGSHPGRGRRMPWCRMSISRVHSIRSWLAVAWMIGPDLKMVRSRASVYAYDSLSRFERRRWGQSLRGGRRGEIRDYHAV